MTFGKRDDVEYQRVAEPRERGQRVVDLCDAVIDRLRFDAGVRLDPDDARVAIFETLAHALFGDGTPIDVPTLRRG